MALRNLVTTGGTCLRNTIFRRCLSLTPRTLGGGHHHPPIPEPYVPKPRDTSERDWLGRRKLPRLSKDSHDHTMDDYQSYIGGAVFVLLTLGAVAFYTDVFGMNIKKNFKHAHHKEAITAKHTESTHSHSEESEKPKPKPAPPVVQEKPAEKKAPEATDKIPDFIPYLLVGSGAASYYASLSIRARDAEAKVLIIGEEAELPYNKPPLSKELWWYPENQGQNSLSYKGPNGKVKDVFFETQGFFVPPNEISSAKHGGVSIVTNAKVKKIDAKARLVHLEDGRSIRYGKCLLATGGHPRRLSVFEPFEKSGNVLYLRNVNDYYRLTDACSHNGTISIVGGGFLGSELAYSIKKRFPETRVVQIIKEAGPLANILPLFLSTHTRGGLERAGVEVRTESSVSGVSKSEAGLLHLTLSDGTSVASNYVVVAVGIEPNVEIEIGDEIKKDTEHGGFRADAKLLVAPSVWCAGDSCAYDTGILGRKRIEHWENAQITGRLAGENMTDGNKSFWYQSSYFSKIGPEMFINAVGNTDSKLHTVSVFAEQETPSSNQYQKGVVFYENKGEIVGCLLINVFGAGLDVARRLIDERRSVGEAKELAKLFSLWDIEREEEKENAKSKSS
ncbi:unnamed protein product, partial [Mesorhabditis belari]|uniref:Uncharacterized protein n=1 Tax=Mesorhabditis belari TaxID=2138241 RepID=A0AAF3EB69_9BILA